MHLHIVVMLLIIERVIPGVAFRVLQWASSLVWYFLGLWRVEFWSKIILLTCFLSWDSGFGKNQVQFSSIILHEWIMNILSSILQVLMQVGHLWCNFKFHVVEFCVGKYRNRNAVLHCSYGLHLWISPHQQPKKIGWMNYVAYADRCGKTWPTPRFEPSPFLNKYGLMC